MSESELSRRGSVSKQMLVEALLETRKQFDRLNALSKNATEEVIVSHIDDLLAKRLYPLRDSLTSLTNKLETLEGKSNELKKEYERLSKHESDISEAEYEEVFQRFAKRKYLIISGIPEATSGSIEERGTEDEEAIESLGMLLEFMRLTLMTYDG